MEKKLLFLVPVVLVVVWSLWYFKFPPFAGPSEVAPQQQKVNNTTGTSGVEPTPVDVAEEIPTNTVIIKDSTFFPQTVIVPKGSSVTFVNRDTVEHSATSANKSFDTGLLGKDEEKLVTFSSPGTYVYTCSKHPNMQGIVVVQQ